MINKKPTNKKVMSSGFWLNQDFIDRMSAPGQGKDAVALAGYKRAVSNFVRIVTGENIPVKFHNNSSYTDGKTVTISTSSDPKDFDSNVGLALHEGAHIKLTDFNDLKHMLDYINSSKYDDFVLSYMAKYNIVDEFGINDRTQAVFKIRAIVKDLHNIVEDRRIDNFVYTTAPGYRGYYNALYDKYFNHKVIDKGLQSGEYRTEDWESYMFRIINITNPNRDLTALKALPKVWDILDLANIGRLESTMDTFNVAMEIFMAVEECIPVPETQERGAGGGGGEEQDEISKGSGSGSGKQDPKGETKEDDDDDGTGSDGEDSNDPGGDDYNGNSKGNQSGDGYDDEGDEDQDDYDELTSTQKAQLEKAIKGQKEFLEGNVKKKNSNKKLDNTVNALETGDVHTKEVDAGPFRKEVIVVRNVTARMIEDVNCGMWYKSSINKTGQSSKAVDEGMILGTMLGKRLKVRSEARDTKFNRLRSGKIDKRMVANAGFGYEGIFQKLETFSYTPSIIHISIDNSGSMGGEKLHNAVKTATAIAKACSMIENMDCVISYRCDTYFAGTHDKPVIVIAYDSRKHKLVQFNQVVKFIGCGGTTPEGLCFDAIMDEVLKGSRGKDAYFLNFSDGEPYSGSYCGEVAFNHTRKQVQKMIANGIKVISYYIGHVSTSGQNNFRSMYGKDSEFIDVSSVTAISKTMNKKFLEIA